MDPIKNGGYSSQLCDRLQEGKFFLQEKLSQVDLFLPLIHLG